MTRIANTEASRPRISSVRWILAGTLAVVALMPGTNAQVPPLEDPNNSIQVQTAFVGNGAVQFSSTQFTNVLGSMQPVSGVLTAIGNVAVGAVSAGLIPTLDITDPVSAVAQPSFCRDFSSVPQIVIAGRSSDRLAVDLEDLGAPENGFGVRKTEIQLQDAGRELYWDGSTWTGVPTWLPATGTRDWNILAETIESWESANPEESAWNRETAYILRSRAYDIAGNLEEPPADNAVLFSFRKSDASTKIDFPVAGVLYGPEMPVATIDGTACPAGTAAVDAIEISIQVSGTTHPGVDGRFEQYWGGTGWVDGQIWLTANGTATWSYPADGIDFGCDPTIVDCGHAIRISARARDVKGDVEELGNSVELFYDVIAPLATQTVPPGGGLPFRMLDTIQGQAKDCGAVPAQSGPIVEVAVVQMVWNGSDFVNGNTYWKGGSNWSAGQTFHQASVTRKNLVPFEDCPAGNEYSYSWEFNQPILSPAGNVDESGFHYRVLVRARDQATNSSLTNLGSEILFDNTPPNAPSADPAQPLGQLVAVSDAGVEIQSGVWQNATGRPTFSWAPPFDNCDPADAGCFLNDASRESSGISQYEVAFGTSPGQMPNVVTLDPLFESGADPGTEGMFYFRARATDGAGNVGGIKDFEVLYDRTPPVITQFLEPLAPAVLYIDSLRRIRVSAAETGAVQSGLTSVQIRLHDDTTNQDWQGGAWGPAEHWLATDPNVGEWWYVTTSVPFEFDHSYKVDARAVDLAGNFSIAAQTGFSIDRPRVTNAVPGGATPTVEFWDDFNISVSVFNPLTETATVTIETFEAVWEAKPSGAPGDIVEDVDFSDYDGTTKRISQTLTIPAGQTRVATFGYEQSWRWQKPNEGDLTDCIIQGIPVAFLGTLPGIGDVITLGSEFKAFLDGVDSLREGLPEVTFRYGSSASETLEDGRVVDTVADLYLLQRYEKVVVPRWKRRELIGSFVLGRSATLTSIVAGASLAAGQVWAYAGLFAAEAVQVAGSCALINSAIDPDPNFQQVVVPSYVRPEDVTNDALLLGDAFNRELFQRQLDLLSNQKALLASRNKYWGALEAGNREWIEKHAAAMRIYADLVKAGYRTVAEGVEVIVNRLEQSGVDLSDEAIEASKLQILNEGLPEGEQDILRFFGFTEDQIALTAAALHDTLMTHDEIRDGIQTLPEVYREQADLVPDDTVIFFENFDDGILDGWNSFSGQWRASGDPLVVESNRVLEGEASTGPARIATTEGFSGSYRVLADAHFAGNPVSVLWNVQNAGNFYELVLSDATQSAFALENGVPRLLWSDSAALDDLDWHHIRIETGEGRHRFFVDTAEDPAAPGSRVPRLLGEVEDDTFVSGGIGLGVVESEQASLFDNVKVETDGNGVRQSLPVLAIGVEPPEPTDQDPVTFTLEAPGDAKEVRLFVNGEQARLWENEGGTLAFTGGPFDKTCRATYSALAVTGNDLLVSFPLDGIAEIPVTDTTPPHLELREASVTLEAEQCDAGVGFIDYNVWQNTTYWDFCTTDPVLTPATPQRFSQGTTRASLTIRDAAGNSSESGFDVTVVNTEPLVSPLVAAQTLEGSTLELTSVARDPRTESLTFSWDWGDGSAPTVRVFPRAELVLESGLLRAAHTASHAYGDDGTYTVTLTVVDDCGSVSQTATTVDVQNVAPVVDFSLSTNDAQTQGVPVSLSGQSSDAGWLDPLQGTVEWGDGTAVEPLNGTLENVPPDATLAFELMHVFPHNGTFTTEVCVSDGATTTCSSRTVDVSNQAPVADAGDDRNVETGIEVSLDGSDSFDPDGDLITYSWSIDWELTAKPDASQLTDADIQGAETPNPSFTPDVDGDYIFRLTVSSLGFDSLPDFVTISATTANTPPNARAGADQDARAGDTVVLDGSASDDPDDGPSPLGFGWSFESLPAASALTDQDISERASAIARFVPDAAGLYVLRLDVTDGEGADQDTLDITVSAANILPMAEAGLDRTVSLGDSVLLDGSASNDPDDGPNPLSFSWTFISRPAGSLLDNNSIQDSTTSLPSFIPDVEGIFVFELEVADGLGSDFDNVMVSVEAEALVCDVDGNNIIDITDIRAITAARGTPAAPGDVRDADGDGVITVLDARRCVLQCTNSRCAP